MRGASLAPQAVDASGAVSSQEAVSPEAVPQEVPPLEEVFPGSDDPDCVDQDLLCGGWATSGECEANPGYMIVKCARSCR